MTFLTTGGTVIARTGLPFFSYVVQVQPSSLYRGDELLYFGAVAVRARHNTCRQSASEKEGVPSDSCRWARAGRITPGSWCCRYQGEKQHMLAELRVTERAYQLIVDTALVAGRGQAVELLVLGVELKPVAGRQLGAVAVAEGESQVARAAVLRVEERILGNGHYDELA